MVLSIDGLSLTRGCFRGRSSDRWLSLSVVLSSMPSSRLRFMEVGIIAGPEDTMVDNDSLPMLEVRLLERREKRPVLCGS